MVIGPWVFVSLSYKDLKDGELLGHQTSGTCNNFVEGTVVGTSNNAGDVANDAVSGVSSADVEQSSGTKVVGEFDVEVLNFFLESKVDVLEFNSLDEVANFFGIVFFVNFSYDSAVNVLAVYNAVPVFEVAETCVTEVVGLVFDSLVSVVFNSCASEGDYERVEGSSGDVAISVTNGYVSNGVDVSIGTSLDNVLGNNAFDSAGSGGTSYVSENVEDSVGGGVVVYVEAFESYSVKTCFLSEVLDNVLVKALDGSNLVTSSGDDECLFNLAAEVVVILTEEVLGYSVGNGGLDGVVVSSGNFNFTEQVVCRVSVSIEVVFYEFIIEISSNDFVVINESIVDGSVDEPASRSRLVAPTRIAEPV